MTGLKYVHAFTDRHGKIRHYFRRGSAPRAALPSPETPEFNRAYQAALAKEQDPDGKLLAPFRARGRRTKLKVTRSRARGSAAGVYLLMQRDRIVYVGSSEDMATRVVAHRTNGRQFDCAYYISVPIAKDRLALEALLIAALRPEQNRFGTKGKTLRGKPSERFADLGANPLELNSAN